MMSILQVSKLKLWELKCDLCKLLHVAHGRAGL